MFFNFAMFYFHTRLTVNRAFSDNHLVILIIQKFRNGKKKI